MTRRMRRPAHNRRSVRSRVLAGASMIATAVLIAAGCGGDGAKTGISMQAVADIRADGGPLRWLDADTTWLVAGGQLDPDKLDVAIETLERLPVWSLAESMLPASDGAGLRAELLKQVARAFNDADIDGEVSAGELEAAFGEHFGLALTGTDMTSFQGGDGGSTPPPIVVWLEVDDRDRALEVVRATAQGTITDKSHEGVDYLVDASNRGAVAVHDDVLVFAMNEAQLKQHIEVFAGSESLAEDADARAVIEAGIGESLAGVAIATDPLLAAAPAWIEGELDADSPVTAAQVREMFAARSVDDVVPDWVAMSLTVDETGLRSRAAWSNPRELAEPEVGARELVERTPASTAMVSAASMDGSMLARVQEVWKDAAETFEIDLREDLLGACVEESAAKDQWACTLLVEALATVLEDDGLAAAVDDAPDRVMAYGIDVQDLRTFVRELMGMQAPGGSGAGAPGEAGEAGTLYSLAWSGSLQLEGWQPRNELRAAMDEAGLEVETDGEQALRVRFANGKPLARELRGALADMTAEDRRTFGALGFDPRELLSAEGLRIGGEQVDDVLSVMTLPPGGSSAWAEALADDADDEDLLGQDEHYRAVVEAAGVPDEVGMFGYVGLLTLIDADWAELVGQDNPAIRALPAVRNNLSDIPGMVTWSERQDVDGEQVGVYQLVMPILE